MSAGPAERARARHLKFGARATQGLHYRLHQFVRLPAKLFRPPRRHFIEHHEHVVYTVITKCKTQDAFLLCDRRRISSLGYFSVLLTDRCHRCFPSRLRGRAQFIYRRQTSAGNNLLGLLYICSFYRLCIDRCSYGDIIMWRGLGSRQHLPRKIRLNIHGLQIGLPL